jgi:hypothetical protein
MNLKDLGVTIRELLRYGYAGGLALLLVWWLAPDARSTIEKAGAVGLTISAIVFGVFIYSVYKVLLCDRIFSPFVEFLHRMVETKNCMHELLASYGVKKGHRLDAFRVLRDTKFSEVIRERIHVQNTELHTVYVTASELIVAGSLAFLREGGAKTALWLLVAGVVTFLIAGLGQFGVCRQESAHFRSLGLDTQCIKELLKSCQLLTDGAATAEAIRESTDRASSGGEEAAI